MDMDAFERLQAEGRLQDAIMRLEEDEETEDDEEREPELELACPFCGEEFNSIGLCFHIADDHPVETKAGVCPICKRKVGVDLIGHLTLQHASFFKGTWRNWPASSGSGSRSSAYSAPKKDAGLLQFRYGGSSRATSLSTVADPLLSSFVGSFVDVDLPKDVQEKFLDEVIEESDSLVLKAAESPEEPLLPEVKEERTKRSQFVQGLVLSLMFDDIL